MATAPGQPVAIEPAQPAPTFTLRDHEGRIVELVDFRGEKAVALVFYPFSFTGVCEGELCQLRDDIAEYDRAGVQVLAISCDPGPAHREWARQKAWTFPVLSDFWPHGEVARAYGVFDEELGCARRATFLVDRDGHIVDTFASDDIGTPREKERYAEALAEL